MNFIFILRSFSEVVEISWGSMFAWKTVIKRYRKINIKVGREHANKNDVNVEDLHFPTQSYMVYLFNENNNLNIHFVGNQTKIRS